MTQATICGFSLKVRPFCHITSSLVTVTREARLTTKNQSVRTHEPVERTILRTKISGQKSAKYLFRSRFLKLVFRPMPAHIPDLTQSQHVESAQLIVQGAEIPWPAPTAPSRMRLARCLPCPGSGSVSEPYATRRRPVIQKRPIRSRPAAFSHKAQAKMSQGQRIAKPHATKAKRS